MPKTEQQLEVKSSLGKGSSRKKSLTTNKSNI